MWFVDTFDIERYLQRVQLPERAIKRAKLRLWHRVRPQARHSQKKSWLLKAATTIQ